jgi:hypothetical protein
MAELERVADLCRLLGGVVLLIGCSGQRIELVSTDRDAGASGSPGASGSSSDSGASQGGSAGSGQACANGVCNAVCDALQAAGNPCVAAHSTTRVLVSTYTGPLYQVCKRGFVPGPSSCASGTSLDIGSLGGYADSVSQDAFCADSICTITKIYDQTPNQNDLEPAPAGGNKPTPDNPANATALKTLVNGHAVYGVLIEDGVGYRKLVGVGTATGDEPQTVYMVTSQQSLIPGCCFDYGNAETDAHDDGNGAAEAVFFGNGVIWGTGSPGDRSQGPWVMGDLENGLFAGWENAQDQDISTNTALRYDFVTGVLVGDTFDKNAGKGRFALYGGDATSGTLKAMYDGARPARPGYVPMHKQGGIVLGVAGDNSDAGGGRWYEGVLTSGAASEATANAIQANIVAAKYGQ